jgi:hypothetical protein
MIAVINLFLIFVLGREIWKLLAFDFQEAVAAPPD